MGFDKAKIEELYPEAGDLMIQPMLIHKSESQQLETACESGEYFGQLKKDGSFYQFVRTANHSYLFGRTTSVKTKLLTEKVDNVPHIKQALEILPARTILIGEIYYPGGTSKDVTPIMGCLPEKAIDRQNGNYGKIHYYIHDILMYDGVNLINENNWLRYKILEKVFHLHNLDNYDFLELAEAWTDNLFSRVGDALANGEEGMVIKKKFGIYEPGKRPMSNLKAKQTDFADVIIIGFEEPTKEYYGKEIEGWQYWIEQNPANDFETKYPVGFYYEDSKTNPYLIPVTKPYYMGWNNARIRIGAYDENNQLKEIGIIHSGISDEMKKDMSDNPNSYLNKICLIQCMSLDKKEKTIRHGFFKSIREDKNIEDCSIKNIF